MGGFSQIRGESKGVITKGSLKYLTFSHFSPALYVSVQSVDAAMLLCGLASSIPTVLELLCILGFPGGGFMAGLSSDLGRGKAHRPLSILVLSC